MKNDSKIDLHPQDVMRIKWHYSNVFYSLFSPLISVYNENSILIQAVYYNFIILPWRKNPTLVSCSSSQTNIISTISITHLHIYQVFSVSVHWVVTLGNSYLIKNSWSNTENKEICTEQQCPTTMLKCIKIKTILKAINFAALPIYAFMCPCMLSFKVQENFKLNFLSFLWTILHTKFQSNFSVFKVIFSQN